MKELRITPIGDYQLKILHILANSPRPINMTVLRTMLGLSSSYDKGYFSLWRSLQTLVGKNLVERIGNEYLITKRGKYEYFNRRRLE